MNAVKFVRHSVYAVLFKNVKNIIEKYRDRYRWNGKPWHKGIYHHKYFSRCKMTPNERRKHDFKWSYKTLIFDSFLQLEQIMKLIHTDLRFNSVLIVVKLLYVSIILAGLKEIKLERHFQYVLTVLKPCLMTLTF